jgi:anthranilate phosphoribosyltransferase
LLGPLVNPAKPAYTLLGVANAATLRLYQYFIQQQKKAYTLIYTTDGYDEISLTADTKVVTASTETVKSPYELGKRTVTATDLFGGATISDAAKIFTNILNGKGSFSQNAVVLANAAMALYSTQRYLTYQDAYNAAVESLDSGAALHAFNTLINMQ